MQHGSELRYTPAASISTDDMAQDMHANEIEMKPPMLNCQLTHSHVGNMRERHQLSPIPDSLKHQGVHSCMHCRIAANLRTKRDSHKDIRYRSHHGS